MDKQVWKDCYKLLPYVDYQGKLVLLPFRTQKRIIGSQIQYRERDETDEEWSDRQY